MSRNKNKCQMCLHEDYCPMQDARSCKGDRWITYKYVPKSYIDAKDWLNQNQEDINQLNMFGEE